MNIGDAFHASMARLASKIGPEIFSIPLAIDPKASYVACTDVYGIQLSSNVVKIEPHNVEVYVSHEIGHHVIGDPEQTSKFHPYIVNLAEDYKINQMIEELFGYDVLKVHFQGMRDKRFDNMSVRDVAKTLMKEGVTSYDHYAQRLPNREILAAAHVWKTRYKVGKRSTYFLMDGMDRIEFIRSIEPSIHKSAQMSFIKNIDMSATMQGLWARLCLPKAVHTVPNVSHTQVIGPSKSLVYCSDIDKHRTVTVGNKERSACISALVLRSLDEDGIYLAHRRQTLGERIRKYDDEITTRRSSRKRRYMKNKSLRELLGLKANAEEALKKLQAAVPIHKMLETQKVRVRKGKRVRIPSLRTFVDDLESGTVELPNVIGDDLSKRIALASRRSANQIEKYIEASAALDSMQDLLNDSPTGSKNRVDQNGDRSGSETDEDEDDGGTQPSPPAPGSGDKDSDSDPADGMVDGDGKVMNPVKTSPQKRSGRGRGAGDGDGGEVTQEMSKELMALENSNTILRIVHLMREIESLLSSTNKRRIKDSPTLPLGLSYGDELENVDSSEFALLANEATKIDFFVRLSQSSLLMRAPIEKRQSAVIVAIDTSGSMMGGRLETAIAFALALGNKLRQQGRGMGMILFHCNVYLSLCFEDKPSLRDLLMAFKGLRSGGTNFYPPLSEALDMRDDKKWKETTTILITDGDGSAGDTTELRKRLTRKDSLQAVLIGSTRISDDNTAELFDEISRIEKKGEMKMSLVSIARKLL